MMARHTEKSISPIPVIYYHSVGLVHPTWSKKYLTLEQRFFEDQIRYIASKFNVISLLDYYKIYNGEADFLPNSLVITFDDGYLDNWVWAYPLLKKYSLPATIFISPEFVDQRNIVRPNLEDVWKGKAKMTDLQQWGFLSWDEMKIMQESGLIDFQSHTLTHTKYFVSGKLVDFHHPGADCLYPAGNLFPHRKPYYIADKDFEKAIAYGYPFFEMKSSVMARKVEINPDFIDKCIESLKDYDFTSYKFNEAFSIAEKLYGEYLDMDQLVISVETEAEYQKRLRLELSESKRIIEEKLDNIVRFLCWPHGDNDSITNQIARETGYLATSLGKQTAIAPDELRFERIGMGSVKGNRFLSLMKAKYKIRGFANQEPYFILKKIYGFYRKLFL